MDSADIFCGIPIQELPPGLQKAVTATTTITSTIKSKHKRLRKVTDFVDIEAEEEEDEEDEEEEDDDADDSTGNLKGFVVDDDNSEDDVDDNDDDKKEWKGALMQTAEHDTIEFMVKNRVPRDIQRLMLAYWNAGDYEDRICSHYLRISRQQSKPIDKPPTSNSTKDAQTQPYVPFTQFEIMTTVGVIAYYYTQRLLFSSLNGLKRTEALLKSDTEFKRIMDRSQSIVERLRSDIDHHIKPFRGTIFYDLLYYPSVAHELRFYHLQQGIEVADKRIVVRTSCIPTETTLSDVMFMSISRDEIDSSDNNAASFYGCYLQSHTEAWIACLAHASAKIHPHVIAYSEKNGEPYFSEWANQHKEDIANNKIKPLDFIRIHKEQIENIWMMWKNTYIRFLKLVQTATDDLTHKV